MSASWFYVKCAECARRFGVDLAPKLFRGDVSDERRAQVRTKAGWRSLLIEDNDRMMWPVVNCAHNHRFEDSIMRNVTLTYEIGQAIAAAISGGAEFGLIEPTNELRAPGETRAAMERDARALGRR